MINAALTDVIHVLWIIDSRLEANNNFAWVCFDMLLFSNTIHPLSWYNITIVDINDQDPIFIPSVYVSKKTYDHSN